jgi:hypothetical protein
MKTPAFSQTLFWDFKDTFQELNTPNYQECISAFDDGNKVISFQKLEKIFGKDWRKSLSILESFLLGTGYFLVYEQVEQYVYLNYRRKKDKNTLQNTEVKRKKEAQKAVIDFILSQDFQKRYEEVWYDYTQLSWIDFEKNTIDGQDFSISEFVDEVGFRIREVLEMDGYENDDRDEDVKEMGDDVIMPWTDMQDWIQPTSSHNGNETDVWMWVAEEPRPKTQILHHTWMNIPENLDRWKTSGKKLKILFEANVGLILSFDAITQYTWFNNDKELIKGYTNLNSRHFSQSGRRVFRLWKNLRYCVLCRESEFEKIQTDFLSIQNNIIWQQLLWTNTW